MNPYWREKISTDRVFKIESFEILLLAFGNVHSLWLMKTPNSKYVLLAITLTLVLLLSSPFSRYGAFSQLVGNNTSEDDYANHGEFGPLDSKEGHVHHVS